MKILLVEDEPITALALEGMLRGMHHEVICVASARDALEVLMRDPVHVLVSDWWMKKMDGLDLCRAVRAQTADYIYFILLTQREATEANKQAAMDAGVDDFLTKPARMPDLQYRLQVAGRILEHTQHAGTLNPFIPVCAWCRKIKADESHWQHMETYFSQRTGSRFTHGICPECFKATLRTNGDVAPTDVRVAPSTPTPITTQGQAWEEYVAGIFHDLRSPLSVLLMGAQAIRKSEASPPSHAGLLDGMVKAAWLIDRMASRFLEQWSDDRVMGQVKLTTIAVDAALAGVFAQARLAAVGKKQILRVETNRPDIMIRADELLLDRAIGNLLDNATKYSPPETEILVRVTDERPGGTVRIDVVDQGPGVKAEEMDQLFRPYVRLSRATTGGEPSFGLGLSLVKRWTEEMNGEVGCESPPGGGARFWLRLPRG